MESKPSLVDWSLDRELYGGSYPYNFFPRSETQPRWCDLPMCSSVLWGNKRASPFLTAFSAENRGTFAFVDELFDSTWTVTQRAVAEANDRKVGRLARKVIPDPIQAHVEQVGHIFRGEESSFKGVCGTRAAKDIAHLKPEVGGGVEIPPCG